MDHVRGRFRCCLHLTVENGRITRHRLYENSLSIAQAWAVRGLGRGLGLPVIAEGVETPEELNFLGVEGCTEVQGYLFSRPVPINELTSLICDNVVVLPRALMKAAVD